MNDNLNPLDENKRLELILGSIGDGVITVDTNNNITMMNKGAEVITGRSSELFLNKPLTEVFKVYDKVTGKSLDEWLLDILKKGEVSGLRKNTVLLTRDGKQKYVSASISPIAGSINLGAVIVFRDITRIRQTEENIINERHNLSLLFDSAPIGMLLTDEKGYIKRVNKSMLSIVDKKEDEVLNKKLGHGLSCANLLSEDKVPDCGMCKSCGLINLIYQTVNTGKGFMGVKLRYNLYINGIKKKLYLKINSVPVIMDNVKHIVIVMEDITERVRVQRELKHAIQRAEAASKAKSEFLANMSHEVRTPLNGMLGMIDLTLLTDLTEEQRENLEIAQSCASTLLNVINDILDFSRIESNKMSLENFPFDLLEFVEQTVRPYRAKAKEKGLNLTCNLNKDLPQTVTGDPYRLRQVINNLLSNAIKFTEKGKITLSSTVINTEDTNVEIEFKVSDTGIGINEKDKEIIFESFSQGDSSITRKYGGSGLGLAICEQLVHMMDGKIWAKGQKGKGSTFCFTVILSISN